MPTQSDQPDETGKDEFVVDANYIAFVLGVTVLTIVNSLLLFVVGGGPELDVLTLMGRFLSVFLFVDAFYWLYRQPRRLHYLTRRHGWLTFIGSVPIPFFGIARLVYLALAVRRIRQPELRQAVDVIVMRRAQTTLLFVVLTAIVIFEIAALLIIGAEVGQPNANIRSAPDAFWWAFVTVSTVGYGDLYPVTLNGRLIAIVLITVGVALFTSITGFLTDWFRRPAAARRSAAVQSPGVDDHPLVLLKALRQTLDEQDQVNQTSMAELRAQLDAIERKLTQDQGATQ